MHKLVGINSLRFFAITLIVAYHLFRDFLPGGFIAVEVFFCVSGFLVTGSIIRQINSDKGLHYGRFILARLKRLCPTLLVCVLFSLLLGIFINPDVMTGARRNSLTALTFTTNIDALISGSNYENTYLPNIFEHTWFLALIFQFYLVLPLIFIIFRKLCRTKKAAISASGIILMLLGISSILIMICYGGFFNLFDRAYFALDSHMFSLCIGSAYAVYKHFWPRSPRAIRRLPYLFLPAGLTAIVYLSFVLHFDQSVTFIFGLPLVTALTILILACIIKLQNNIHERHKTMTIVRIFEGLGALSYGVYLFHWPLYALLPHLLPPDTSDWGYAIINISLSILLASVTYKIFTIKNLYRKISRTRRRAKITYATFAAGVLAVVAITLVRAPKTSSIAEQLSAAAERDSATLISETTQQIDYIGASQILDETTYTLDAQLRLAQDAEILPPPTASLAAPNANAARVLVIGDSVTLGAKQAIESTIAQSFVDAKENRGIETARGILAGYAASGKLPSIIVISLATNQRTITDQILQDIINVGGDKHKYILVTAYAGPLQPRDTQNATLKSFAQNHSNVYLADWWEISHDDWSLMYADHIHLNPSGRAVYANLLSNTIRGMR